MPRKKKKLKNRSIGTVPKKMKRQARQAYNKAQKKARSKNITHKERNNVKCCPHCNHIIKGSYKEHLESCRLRILWGEERSEDALDRPSTLLGGHWESNRRRH